MNAKKFALARVCWLIVVGLITSAAFAQTSGTLLLALSKSDKTVAIVDPATLEGSGAGCRPDPIPHEIIASD